MTVVIVRLKRNRRRRKERLGRKRKKYDNNRGTCIAQDVQMLILIARFDLERHLTELDERKKKKSSFITKLASLQSFRLILCVLLFPNIFETIFLFNRIEFGTISALKSEKKNDDDDDDDVISRNPLTLIGSPAARKLAKEPTESFNFIRNNRACKRNFRKRLT